LGRSEKRALKSAIRSALEASAEVGLINLNSAAMVEQATILEQRLRIQDLLTESPSLIALFTNRTGAMLTRMPANWLPQKPG
jgi:hypothetical protein